MTQKVVARLRARGVNVIEVCQGIFAVLPVDASLVAAAMADQPDFLKWFNRGYTVRRVGSDAGEFRYRFYSPSFTRPVGYAQCSSVFSAGIESTRARVEMTESPRAFPVPELAATGATAIFFMYRYKAWYEYPEKHYTLSGTLWNHAPKFDLKAVRLGTNVYAGAGRWPGVGTPTTPNPDTLDRPNNGWLVYGTDWPKIDDPRSTEHGRYVNGGDEIFTYPSDYQPYAVRATCRLSVTDGTRVSVTNGARTFHHDASPTLRLVSGPQAYDWGELAWVEGGTPEGAFFISNATFANVMIDSIEVAQARGLANREDVARVRGQAAKVAVTEGGLGAVRLGRMSPWYLSRDTIQFADKLLDKTGVVEGYDFDLLRKRSQEWCGFSAGGSFDPTALQSVLGTDPLKVGIVEDRISFTGNDVLYVSHEEGVARASELVYLGFKLVRGSDVNPRVDATVVNDILAAPAVKPRAFAEDDACAVLYSAGLYLGRGESTKGTHPGVVYCKPAYLEPRA